MDNRLDKDLAKQVINNIINDESISKSVNKIVRDTVSSWYPEEWTHPHYFNDVVTDYTPAIQFTEEVGIRLELDYLIVSLPVANYSSFDACSEALEDAKEQFLKDTEGQRLGIIFIEFIAFDSNRRNASGFFKVAY